MRPLHEVFTPERLKAFFARRTDLLPIGGTYIAYDGHAVCAATAMCIEELRPVPGFGECAGTVADTLEVSTAELLEFQRGWDGKLPLDDTLKGAYLLGRACRAACR